MATEVMETPVIFTEGAKKEIKRLMAASDFDAKSKLRIGVKGGGCSGLSYELGFGTPDEKDKYFEVDGIPCIINVGHELYLAGMQIDWSEGLNNRGFTFSNPNASDTCGCGTSFAV